MIYSCLMAENLKEKTVTGVLWSAVQKFGSTALSFISTIVLARLLTPEDYGCIGMLSIFLAVASTCIDGGFGSALIQKQRPTREDYSTIFYWNLGLALVLYIILFFSAPAIARFYNLPLLCSVLRVQGVVLIINAIRIVQTNQLRKQLKFKKIASVDLSVAALSLAVTIYLAWKGFGVWALVAQQLMVSVLTTSIYWITGHWWPLLTFSKQSFKELFGFGGFILLSNLINTFCNNIQGLLIGKFYNPATMGYYSKAKSTEELSSTFISSVIDQVSYPVLAEAQNDKEYLIRMLRKFIGVLAYVTFPIMLLLILLAKPLFILLYSERWLSSVPYFQILCLAGMAICLQGINYYAIAAVGKSGKLFLGTLVKRGVGLLLIIGGLLLAGMKGLLGGMVLSAYFIYLVNAFLVSKHVGYSLAQQFKDLLPMILTSIVSFVLAFIVGYVLKPFANMYITGVAQLIVFAIVYLVMSKLMRLEEFDNSLEILYIFTNKLKKK